MSVDAATKEPAARGEATLGRLRALADERFAVVVLAAAMVCAAGLILWLNRGTTFWLDEILVYLESPDFGLREAIQPHLGHLVITSRVETKLLLELFGATYLPFRLLALASLLFLVGLFFVYARRLVGGWVALAPCLVLLFFGPDWLHVLMGNGFGVLLSVSAGVGALLALERGSRRADLLACGLLLLGIVTYSLALAFVVGAGIWILLGPDRRRRLWVVLVPGLLYTAWWLWSRDHTTAVGSDVSALNILLVPAWSFQSLSATLSALVGLSYQFPGGSPAPQVGPVLAAAAILGVGLRLAAGSVPRSLWAAISVVLALWTLGALTAGEIRFPENPRYLFPISIGLLLVAVESLRGVRWSPAAIVAVFLVAAAGIGANLIIMRDQAAWLREVYTRETRATFGALDLTRRSAEPRLDFSLPDGSTDVYQNLLAGTLAHLEEHGEAVRAYYEASDRYGSLGYSLTELRAQSPQVRERADTVLAQAVALRPTPVDAVARGAGCAGFGGAGAAPTGAEIPPGGALIGVRGQAPAPAFIGRLADGEHVPLGRLSPGEPVRLRVPPDAIPEPWRVSAPGARLVVCPLR